MCHPSVDARSGLDTSPKNMSYGRAEARSPPLLASSTRSPGRELVANRSQTMWRASLSLGRNRVSVGKVHRHSNLGQEPHRWQTCMSDFGALYVPDLEALTAACCMLPAARQTLRSSLFKSSCIRYQWVGPPPSPPSPFTQHVCRPRSRADCQRLADLQRRTNGIIQLAETAVGQRAATCVHLKCSWTS